MFFQKTVFFLKFGEPLPISIDPFCFLIDQKFLNMFMRVFVCFDRSNLFKIVYINLCLFRSIEAIFRSIETRETCFLKGQIVFFKRTFSKSFSTFLSLSDLAKAPPLIFCCFPPKIFARFLSLKAGKSLLPFLLHFISCFHAFFMHCCGYFWHFQYIGVFDVSHLFW